MNRALDVFYPIVPDAAWVARIVPLGVKTIQLRVKDAVADEVRRQIRKSIEVARPYDCQLIINDYWADAIAMGADDIHLGQEDLAGADIAAIKAAGLRLGVSTHSEHELSTAMQANPDYVALGPIFETKLKAMVWAPQGLERITQWKDRIGGVPLVAIGGITLKRAPSVFAAGAQSVCAITDFLTHDDPDTRIKNWLKWAETARQSH